MVFLFVCAGWAGDSNPRAARTSAEGRTCLSHKTAPVRSPLHKNMRPRVQNSEIRKNVQICCFVTHDVWIAITRRPPTPSPKRNLPCTCLSKSFTCSLVAVKLMNKCQRIVARLAFRFVIGECPCFELACRSLHLKLFVGVGFCCTDFN